LLLCSVRYYSRNHVIALARLPSRLSVSDSGVFSPRIFPWLCWLAPSGTRATPRFLRRSRIGHFPFPRPPRCSRPRFSAYGRPGSFPSRTARSTLSLRSLPVLSLPSVHVFEPRSRSFSSCQEVVVWSSSSSSVPFVDPSVKSLLDDQLVFTTTCSIPLVPLGGRPPARSVYAGHFYASLFFP